MKSRPTLWQKIWRKVRPPKSAVAPRPPERPPKRGSTLEPLEGRIAPASLVNPNTLIYKDLDGDIVTVKFSKPIFATAGSAPEVATLANQIFRFSNGIVDGSGFTDFDPTTAVAQQLQLIDLNSAPISPTKGNVANGTGISITVTQGFLAGPNGDEPGDGFANVGYIKATGIALGKVAIAGDLGQIDTGGGTAKTGLGSLTVQSLGAKGLTTQSASSPSLESTIVGGLGSLAVAGDVKDAWIRSIDGTDFLGRLLAPARIGSVSIGGSLIGGTGTSAGSIESFRDIGAVKIGSAFDDGIVGGSGQNSGSLVAGGKIASVLLTGDLVGGSGSGSGQILAGGNLGKTAITGNLEGAGNNSGLVKGATITSVALGGDLIAGTGIASGLIATGLGNLGKVTIGGDIDATTKAAGADSGGISAIGKITSVALGGALRGGVGAHSGFILGGTDIGNVSMEAIAGGGGQNSGTIIASGKIVKVLVAGDLTGGEGASSGAIFGGFDPALAGDLGSVAIGGKVVGGGGANSGAIASTGKIKTVTIGPKAAVNEVLLAGGEGDWSCSIFTLGGLGTVKIMGHVAGGAGDFSGAIVTRDAIDSESELAGDLGTVTIAGQLRGGLGDSSGFISADGKLSKATVGGLIGGDGDRSGAMFAGQGIVRVGDTGAITIKGDLTGGTGDQSGGVVAEGRIAKVTVEGLATGGTIRAGDDLKSLVFKQSVDGTVVAAYGQAKQSTTKDAAIGSIVVGGNVANARFLAGYDTTLAAMNADAQIGAVKVAGDWTASDLVAGVIDGGNAGFGTAGDAAIGGGDSEKIVSSIASILIGGTVSGTTDVADDHFGFTAQKIGAFKIGGIAQPLDKLANSQVLDLVAGDVTIREVAVPMAM